MKKSKFIGVLQKVANPKSYLRKPYNYVPPCPACGDRMTGTYFNNSDVSQVNWIIEEALRNGELLKPGTEDQESLAFCCNCGFEWEHKRTTQWLTLSEIDREKSARQTVEILSQRLSEKQPKKTGSVKGLVKNMGASFADPVAGIIHRKNKEEQEESENEDSVDKGTPE